MTAAAKSSEHTPASRTFVAIGFVLATLFTGAVSVGGNIYSSYKQSQQAARSSQVDKLQDAAGEFPPLVKSFVADVKSGGVTPKTRDKIRANLMKQSTALTGVKSVAAPKAYSKIDAYQATLARADTAIKSAKGPLNSKDFAQEAIHIAEQQDALFKALR